MTEEEADRLLDEWVVHARKVLLVLNSRIEPNRERTSAPCEEEPIIV